MIRGEAVTIHRTEYHDDATDTTYYIDRDPRTSICTAWLIHYATPTSHPALFYLGESKQEEKARGMIEAHAQRKYWDNNATKPKGWKP